MTERKKRKIGERLVCLQASNPQEQSWLSNTHTLGLDLIASITSPVFPVCNVRGDWYRKSRGSREIFEFWCSRDGRGKVSRFLRQTLSGEQSRRLSAYPQPHAHKKQRDCSSWPACYASSGYPQLTYIDLYVVEIPEYGSLVRPT